MNIILIAHSQTKTISDPRFPLPFDRTEPKTKAAALLKESVDCVFLATFEMYMKADKSGQKAKAFGDGKRIMLTHGMPSHEAKNRFDLPYELPLSWEAYIQAKEKGEPESPQILKDKISKNIETITDIVLKAKVLKATAEAGDDASKLSKILNRLEVINGN